MSRIGKMPVAIPAGVEVKLEDGNTLMVKGPKGTLRQSFHKDMTLAVENLPPPRFTSDASDLRRLVEEYPTDVVGACIDTGHGHLGGRVVEVANMLASRALVSHLHDNIGDGQGDKHLIPGRGTIPWAEVAEAMREFRGKPVMEVMMTGTLGETLVNVEKAIVETGLCRIIG
jgi:hypothetical protein